jgi:hypothetical protein
MVALNVPLLNREYVLMHALNASSSTISERGLRVVFLSTITTQKFNLFTSGMSPP